MHWHSLVIFRNWVHVSRGLSRDCLAITANVLREIENRSSWRIVIFKSISGHRESLGSACWTALSLNYDRCFGHASRDFCGLTTAPVVAFLSTTRGRAHGILWCGAIKCLSKMGLSEAGRIWKIKRPTWYFQVVKVGMTKKSLSDNSTHFVIWVQRL